MNNEMFENYLKELENLRDILSQSKDINRLDKTIISNLFSFINTSAKLAIFNEVLSNNGIRNNSLSYIDNKISAVNEEIDDFISVEASKLFKGQIDKINPRILLMKRDRYKMAYDNISDDVFYEYSRKTIGDTSAKWLVNECVENLIPGYKKLTTYFGSTLATKNKDYGYTANDSTIDDVYNVINSDSFMKDLVSVVDSYNEYSSIEEELNNNKKVLNIFKEAKNNISDIYKFLSLINEYKELIIKLDNIEKEEKDLRYKVSLIDGYTLFYRITNMFKRNKMALDLYKCIDDKEYILERKSSVMEKIHYIINGIKDEELNNLCNLLLDKVCSFEYDDKEWYATIEKPEKISDEKTLLQYVAHSISKNYASFEEYDVNIDLLIIEFKNKIREIEFRYNDASYKYNNIYNSINPSIRNIFDKDFETCNNLVNLKNSGSKFTRRPNTLICFYVLKLVCDTKRLGLEDYKKLYNSDVINSIFNNKSIESLEDEYEDMIDNMVNNNLSKVLSESSIEEKVRRR